MDQVVFKRYRIFAHVGVWAILFMINLLDDLGYVPTHEAVIYALHYTAIVMLVVYGHYYLILPLFHQGKKTLHFFLTLLLILGSILLYHYTDEWLPYEYPYEAELWESFIYNFLILILFVGVSSLSYLVEAWYQNLQRESLLRSEKLQAELNFLKSQINPHFLFNTLNNIYAYAQTGNEKTAPMLERLSSILRFMVYDCIEQKVSLAKEVGAVEDLLEIYKMKNSAQQNINFSMEGVKGYHLIAPLIIVNLVENACKHSDAVHNPKGYIHIQLVVDEHGGCLLEIANSVKQKEVKPNPYGGIGLDNVKKRLDLQYNEAYDIQETKEEGHYKLYLKIPLDKKQ